MLKPHIDPVTLDITCPICQQARFTVFRRDPQVPGLFLNHCKCACGQLFVYHVDDFNQPVLDLISLLANQPKARPSENNNSQAVCCPRCKGERFTIFRRERSRSETLLCFARCLACEGHFTYKLNRANQLLARSTTTT